jgi:hypothetical protein
MGSLMNINPKVVAIVGAIGICGMVTLQACDMRSFVVVDVPQDVLEAVDLPEGRLTLDEVDATWQDWKYYVETNTKRFEDAVADAEDRYAVIHQIFSIGLTTAGEASQGIPYGGLLFGALTGITGLMLPQPKFSRKKE